MADNSVKANNKKKDDKHLSLDISTFQRKLMLTGVDPAGKLETISEIPVNEQIKETKENAMAENIVGSLKTMRKNNEPDAAGAQSYEEFVRDPEGNEYKKRQI